MVCGLPVVLVYREGLWALGYSYIGIGMGYRLWHMDWLYCWYVGMGYGLLSLLADWDGVWDMGYGLPVLLVYRDGIWATVL